MLKLAASYDHRPANAGLWAVELAAETLRSDLGDDG
jgi:hypothetical protein